MGWRTDRSPVAAIVALFGLMSGPAVAADAVANPTAPEPGPIEVVVSNPAQIKEVCDWNRLQGILVGQVATWDDGTPITVVISKDAAGNQTLHRILKRGVIPYLAGWKRLAFSGMGRFPQVTGSQAESLGLVRNHAGFVTVLDGVPPDDREGLTIWVVRPPSRGTEN